MTAATYIGANPVVPFAPGFDGPCPELGGDFDLPACVFERRQRGRDKLLPALGQVAALEQKDARSARAGFHGKPHHRKTALSQPIECGCLAETVATVKVSGARVTGELPLVFQVDACLAIQKATLRDVDCRAPVPAGRVALNKVKCGTGLPATMTAGAADRSRLPGGWFGRLRTSPARVVAPGSRGSEAMSLARPTAPVWASTYHATVPSMIALPFERPMAIGQPVRGLCRARKSRGKFLTRGVPEDAQRACPVASICSMMRSTRTR